MNRSTRLAVTLVAAGCVLSACTQTQSTPSLTKPAANSNMTHDNPLLATSKLSYELPPLNLIKNEHFKPALEFAMAEERKNVNDIANNPAAATFENTIVAMERSGLLLARVNSVFSSLAGSYTNPELEALQTEMAPKFAAHSDAIALDAKLFARIQSLYKQRAQLKLDAESLRLLERYHTTFVRAGAQLSDADKTKLKQFNERLSTLTTEFRQQVLKGVNAGAVIVDNVKELDGLSDEQIATAAAAAKSRKLDGRWVITLLNTTGQPPLDALKNRALRERIYRASVNRGFGGEFDTTKIVAELVKIRAERAVLLGYVDHAGYILEDETALNSVAVNKFLAQLATPATANAKREAAEIQKVIDAEARANGTPSFKLQAWDWDFYAEKVRQARYAFDAAQVKPYFEMNRVMRDGVLFAAEKLYGLKFKERSDLPTYQADMKVFEIFNADGSPVGLVLFDWYARENKRGGAWMSSYVDQARLLGTHAVVTNNLNIPKPPEGQPTLLTFDEVTTAFHEFGHALHGLFSNVNYPQFSGTSVPRDFVEYPSQYNEMWATDTTVLVNYAKHYATGAPIPRELLDKVLAAKNFNQGFTTAEYLQAAILDQAWHQLKPEQVPAADKVAEFEAQALQRAGIAIDAVPPRYRSTYFSHLFSSPMGYSAGYYAYIWSETLAADTESWFKSHGGLQRSNGDLLREKVLSKGFSADPLTIFKDFYGRDPEVAPLLESRGLVLSAE
jgi:peptidyl-dipeptidase Dcp